MIVNAARLGACATRLRPNTCEKCGLDSLDALILLGDVAVALTMDGAVRWSGISRRLAVFLEQLLEI